MTALTTASSGSVHRPLAWWSQTALDSIATRMEATLSGWGDEWAITLHGPVAAHNAAQSPALAGTETHWLRLGGGSRIAIGGRFAALVGRCSRCRAVGCRTK